MTRARNIAGFSTITTTPSPVHVGPIGVLTATRIDGEFNLVDLDTRDVTAQGIGVTNLQVSGITTGLNVSGIITAQNGINFNGTSTGLNVSGVGTIATLNVTGNATVGGVLTYEDVTNIDSIGIITARSGMVVSGVSTFSGALQSKGDVNPNAVFDRGSANTTNVNVNYNGTLTGQLAAANGDFQISAAGSSTPMSFYANGSERARITSSGNLLINKTTDRNVYYGGTFSGLLQVEGTGNLSRLTQFVHNANAVSQHILVLGKSRGTSVGSYTAVQASDYLGTLSFQGADGDAMIESARIDCMVDGTPGNNDMPGRLMFGTTPDGASSTVERMRIDSAGQVGINDTSPDAELSVAAVTGNAPHVDIGQAGGNRLKLGYEGNNCFFGGSSSTAMFIFKNNVNADGHPQASGTERMRIDQDGKVKIGTTATPTQSGALNVFGTSQITSQVSIRRGSADAGGPRLHFQKSRNTTDGSHTVVQSGDVLGSIMFAGNDGQGPENGALIEAEVDAAAGSNDIPTRLVFSTTPDGSDTLAEALRLTSDKIVNIAGQGSVYGRLNVPIPTTSGGAAIQIMNTAGGSGDGTLTNVALRSVNSVGSQWAHAQYRAQSHAFQMQSTTKVTINSNGLCFNSDTAAANALDDYEEGTWTPQMHDGNGSNVVLTVLSGRNIYIKIGQLCYISANVTLNDTGKSGVLVMTHLPFNSFSEGQLAAGNWWMDRGGPSQGDIVGGVVYKTGNDAKLYFVNPTNGDSNSNGSTTEADTRYWEFSQWTNGRPVYINLTYKTS